MLLGTGPSNPYLQYRQNQIATASPHQLLLMLFDGALRFVRQAGEALDRRDYCAANNYLGRAQQILAELMGALDFKQGKLPENLFKIYEYMQHRLVEANIQKDREPLEEVKEMLVELRESWARAARGTQGDDSFIPEITPPARASPGI